MSFYSVRAGHPNPNNPERCPNIKAKLLMAVCIVFLCLVAHANSLVVTNPAGLSASVNLSGNYFVRSPEPEWVFSGEIGFPLKNANTGEGVDSLGRYLRISLEWMEGSSQMHGEIRLYQESPLVIFSDFRKSAGEMPPMPFPSFTKMPKDIHVFSYRQEAFAPPQFAANACSTPWLLFDDRDYAAVISPASHFMVASMLGDGKKRMASGFNPRLRNLPAGFSQQTMLAFGHGINRTWDLWGQSLRKWEGAGPLHISTDATLKYLGYWTDNGASLYYNFDIDKGYAGTL